MNKILFDTLGIDKGYKEVVLAGINSVNSFEEIEVTFLGNEKDILDEIKKYKCDFKRIKVINAPTEISCNDIPTKAIKEKTDSSLVVGFEKLNEDYDAFISGGSTGALLIGGFLKVGRIRGVSRPALCPLLPTLTNKSVMLIDCGANVDCKPAYLCDFALMANIYMREVMKISSPRIGLLNIGLEENKGNELAKQTYEKLKTLPINFVGNVEARDVFSGNYDVVVSDGFCGNILLKGSEGAINLILTKLKAEIKSSFLSKIGALFMKKTFKNIKKSLNMDYQGGSVLLGIKKPLIKVHGSSSHVAFEVAVKQAIDLKNNHVLEKFEEEFSKSIEE